MKVPVHMARKLRSEGMAWRDVSQELAWATGRVFAFDSVQNAVYASRRKVLHLPIPKQQEISFIHDGLISALWAFRLDTRDIAKLVRLPESGVANRLLHLREVA